MVHGEHLCYLLVALHDVAFVFDRLEHDAVRAAREAGSNGLSVAVRMRTEATFVNAVGNEPADGRVHSARILEEQTFGRRNDGVELGAIGLTSFDIEERVLQGGKSGPARVGALNRLLELHLVAK